MTGNIEDKPTELTRRQQRKSQFLLGSLLLGFLFVFGVPILVGLSYHILGWQIAVLLFPALYAAIFWALPTPARNRKRPGTARKWILRSILVGIPVFSVWFSDPSYMRAWAVAVAVSMFVSITIDKPGSVNMTRRWLEGSDLKRRLVHSGIALSGAALFVLLSELIWHFLSLGPWIWFHAFAMTIFMTLWMSLIALVSKLVSGEAFGTEEPKKEIKKGRRPSIRSSKDAERYNVSHHQADGSIIQYKDVSPEQAKWLFARVEWDDATPASKRSDSIGRHSPKFTIDFDGFFLLTMRPDGCGLVRVDWFFTKPRRSWQIWGERVSFAATRVPVDQIDGTIDLAWSEKWEEIEAALSVHIKEQLTPTA